MLATITGRISDYLVAKQVFAAEDQEIVFYRLFIVLSDFFQVGLLLALSCLLGLVLPVCVFAGFYAGIRRFAGGWHAPNQLACVNIFTPLALILSWLGQRLPWEISLVFMVGAVTIVFLRAPISHPNNPKTPQTLAKFRRRSRFMVISQGIVIGIWLGLSLPALAGCAVLGCFAAAFTLLWGKEV